MPKFYPLNLKSTMDNEHLDFLFHDFVNHHCNDSETSSDCRLLASLENLEHEIQNEICYILSSDNKDSTKVSTPKIITEHSTYQSMATTSEATPANDAIRNDNNCSNEIRSTETNEINFIPALKQETEDMMVMMTIEKQQYPLELTTPNTPSTISDSSPIRISLQSTLSPIDKNDTVLNNPTLLSSSSPSHASLQPNTMTLSTPPSKPAPDVATSMSTVKDTAPNSSMLSTSAKSRFPTPTKKMLQAAQQQQLNSNTSSNNVSTRSGNANGVAVDIKGDKLLHTITVKKQINADPMKDIRFNSNSVRPKVSDPLLSIANTSARKSSTSTPPVRGTSANRNSYTRTNSSPIISASSSEEIDSNDIGHKKMRNGIKMVARSKSTSSGAGTATTTLDKKLRIVPVHTKKSKSAESKSPTSQHHQSAADAVTMSSSKTKIEKKLLQVTTVNPTTRTSLSNIRTTTESKPMNPVLAERRANAAATSVRTPYKVSVTGNKSSTIASTDTTTSIQQLKNNKSISNSRIKPEASGDAKTKNSKKVFSSAIASLNPTINSFSGINGSSSTDCDVSMIEKILELSVSDRCVQADKMYEAKLLMPFTKGSVSVISSFLSKDDESALQLLVENTKNQKVKIFVSDSFQRQKTTICILPVDEPLPVTDPDTKQAINTVAIRRSMKAMEAMLHGVPIVSPEWITACVKNDNIPIMPKPSMYIRSLPSKSLVVDGGDSSSGVLSNDYGIAFIGAALDASKGTYKPLGLSSLAFVYVAGFSAVKQGGISELLRDSGTKEVITKSTDAINHMKKRVNHVGKDVKLVFLCNDTYVTTITPELEALTKQYAKKSKKGTVWIVNSNWLYDSITCGSALFTESSWNNELYKPVGGKGLEFWNMIRIMQGADL